MKKNQNIILSKSILRALFLGVIWLSFFSACNRPDSLPVFGEAGGLAKIGGVSGVTILFPADGDQFQVGDFIDVHSQIGDPSGVTTAVLTVNDEPLRHDQLVSPVADGDLYQPWTPDAPGTYVLQVILETTGGGQHISDPITVVVGEGATPTFTTTMASETPPVSETPTITDTLEITPTSSPSVTPDTPTVTPTSDKATATGLQNSNCRKGPDTRYDVQGYLMEGETVPIVGRNDDSSWWVVELQDPLKECWVWGGGVSTSGNMADLVVIKPPPPPTFTPTPTNTPKPPTWTPTPTKHPTKNPYNACHDYPDIQTCNSDPEGFGNCTWDTGMNKCQP